MRDFSRKKKKSGNQKKKKGAAACFYDAGHTEAAVPPPDWTPSKRMQITPTKPCVRSDPPIKWGLPPPVCKCHRVRKNLYLCIQQRYTKKYELAVCRMLHRTGARSESGRITRAQPDSSVAETECVRTEDVSACTQLQSGIATSVHSQGRYLFTYTSGCG